MKPAPAALVYDDSAYLETLQRPSDAGTRGPHGLMGRQVAGHEVLDALLPAPCEPYDALICTSTAVVRMVRAVTDAYAGYLRDRCGGDPRLRVRLETIPLGVNPERFRPPTPAERAQRRAALHIADDEVAVLFVRRFTPHAKAHPFPMLQGPAPP